MPDTDNNTPKDTAVQLLAEIEAVIKQRAVGHSIMYSDRITKFLPRIKAVLEQEKK